jgi:hypothetical protein
MANCCLRNNSCELEAERRFHLVQLIEENAASGVPPRPSLTNAVVFTDRVQGRVVGLRDDPQRL